MEAAIAGQNDPEIWQARSSGSINDYGLIISELKIGGSYPLKKSMLMHVIDLSSKKTPNHVKHQ
jgi:hypothetical protein